MVEINNSV